MKNRISQIATIYLSTSLVESALHAEFYLTILALMEPWQNGMPIALNQIVNSVNYKENKYLEKSGGVSGDNNSIL